MKTFSLEVSKRFKELGIEVESEFYWSVFEKEWGLNYGKPGNVNDTPAYTLQDLPYLLEELENVKELLGWTKIFGIRGIKDGTYLAPDWKSHFVTICSLYFEHRELGEGSECEKYLLDLMK